jgi:hypothetical protein
MAPTNPVGGATMPKSSACLTALRSLILALVAASALAVPLARAAGPADVVKGVFTPNNQVPNQHTEMEQRDLQVYRNQEDHGTSTYQPPSPPPQQEQNKYPN